MDISFLNVLVNNAFFRLVNIISKLCNFYFTLFFSEIKDCIIDCNSFELFFMVIHCFVGNL